MAEHLLLPKRLARRLPWLHKAMWWVEAQLVRAIILLLHTVPVETAYALSMRSVRLLGPWLRMNERLRRNLAIAFADKPAAERNRMLRATFAHLGAAVADMVLADRLWEQHEQRFEFRADPAIEGLRNGKPMVLVTAHVGPWQLTNLVARRFGIPLTSLYAPESNPYFAEITAGMRHALGCHWIASDGGIRRLMEELRAGRSVGLACDTRLDQGEAVPFFGEPAMTNTIPARLALRLGCELVPVRSRRLSGTRFSIDMQAPVRPRNPEASPAEQALDMHKQLNERFEQWIRESPGEWMCLARRWSKERDASVRTA
jgi:Kdo2-lipid IVA lauroyltransferase/acyltransferase